MSDDGLKREIKRLVAENEQLRSDLMAAKGKAPPGEVHVFRYGVDLVSRDTFHLRISVYLGDAIRLHPDYVGGILSRASAEIERVAGWWESQRTPVEANTPSQGN